MLIAQSANKRNLLIATSESDESFKKVYGYTYLYILKKLVLIPDWEKRRIIVYDNVLY